MQTPATITTVDWSTDPADHNSIWIAGATMSLSHIVVGKTVASTSGAGSKISGSLLSDVTATTPPDLPILGRGGNYEITFGMYNHSVSALSISTEGLLSNTLLQGNLLA